MALNIVELPYSYFPDFSRGRPLFNADIYVGNVNTAPEIPANQKQVTVRQEDGTEVQIAQPVKTSAGGVPTYNGSPVTILVSGSYSIKVLDRLGAEEYYSPDVTKGVPLTADSGIILYKAAGGNSAVENMVAGAPFAASVGDICSTGEGLWVRVSENNLLSDFKPISKIYASDFGAVGDDSVETNVFTQMSEVLEGNKSVELVLGRRLNYRVGEGVYFLALVDGKNSTIKLEENAFLSREGADVFDLKDLTFRKIGNRGGPADVSAPFLYDDANKFTITNDITRLSNVKYYSQSTDNDSSWQDDVNQLRGEALSVITSEKINIEGFTAYGANGVLVRPVTDGISECYINNTKGYNTQTLVNVTSSDVENLRFKDTSVTRVKLQNTQNEQGYWINQNNKPSPLGHDAVLVEVQHTNSCTVDDVTAIRAQERSVYCQSNNSKVTNTKDIESGFGSAQIKVYPDGSKLVASNSLINSERIQSSIGEPDLQLYGQDKGTVSGLRYSGFTGSTRPLISLLAQNNNTQIKDIQAKNAGRFIDVRTDNVLQSRIDISDVNLKDVNTGASGSNASVVNFLGTLSDHTFPTLSDFNLNNVNSYLSRGNTSATRYAMTLWKTQDVSIDTMSADFNLAPFDSTGSTGLSVVNSSFTFWGNSGNIRTAFNAMDIDEFSADVFSFTIKTAKFNTQSAKSEWEIDFSKRFKSGMVRCVGYWSELRYQQEITLGDTVYTELPFKDGLRVTASIGNSYIEGVYNGSQVVYTANVGNQFSETTFNGFIQIYYNAGTDSLIIRRDDSGAQGYLKVTCFHK